MSEQNQSWWPELGPDGRVWVFTGDSITHGVVHTGTSRDYVELFAEQIRWPKWGELVFTTAFSGWQIVQLADRLDWAVLRHNPDVVSLMLGTNDCADEAATNPARFGAAYREVLDRITDSGDPRVILQTPPGVRPEAAQDRFARLPGFVDEIRSIAAERNLLLVDHFAHWQQAGAAADAWYDDPFHPNASGHIEMAGLLGQTLQVPPRP
ncbi:SGNH/GDSL hydrolase family protein [Nakamurella lactea]|uniref:SGNH/GDSL hydrolase family protein n=1 Tax=Nakamurella lactea TaxID=459515 RepID=UPI00041B3AE7|nr:GDSL-type esterase/lipase family protein [Nakamurella lactea]